MEEPPGARWQPQQSALKNEGSSSGAEYEAMRQEMERLTRKVCVGAQGGPVLLNGVEYQHVPLAAFQISMQHLLQRFRATLGSSRLQRDLESRGYTSDWDIGVEDLRVPQMEALVEDTFEKHFPRDPTGQPCSAPGQAEGGSSSISARDYARGPCMPPSLPGPANFPSLGTASPPATLGPMAGGEVLPLGGASASAFPADCPWPAPPGADLPGVPAEHAHGPGMAGSSPQGGPALHGCSPAVAREWQQGAGPGDHGRGEREWLMTRTVDQLVQQARERERAAKAAPLLCLRELQQAEEERKSERHKKKAKRRRGEEPEKAGREKDEQGPGGRGDQRNKEALPGGGRGLGWRQMWERLEDPRKSHVPNLVYSKIKRALEAHEGEWAPVEAEDIVLRIEFQYPDPNAYYRKGQEFLVLGSQALSELRDRIYCIHDRNAKDHNISTPSGFFCFEDVLYDDMRSTEAVAYSKTFLDWNQEKRQEGDNPPQDRALGGPLSALGMGAGAQCRRPKGPSAPALPVYSSARMEATLFRDLNIRPGALYVYFHQGGCKHAFKATDIHLLHPQDCNNAMAYPLLTHEPRYSVRKCMVCDVAGCTKVVYGDRLSNTDPSFYCTHCYYSLHYSGNKLLYSDFKVFDYYHE